VLGVLCVACCACAARGGGCRSRVCALRRLAGLPARAARAHGPRRAFGRLAGGAGGAEHAQLALCALCLAAALAAQKIGLSLEVGAFAGGLLLSADPSAPEAHACALDAASGLDADVAAAAHTLEPVRNFFGALFLAAVGMTFQWRFLWSHKAVLLLAALGIGAAKAAAVAGSLLACGVPRATACACGLGLANVGELGFVLLSRARGLGLISRPLFLLLIGTTALSLWATPAVFGAGVRRLGARSGRARAGGGGGSEGEGEAGSLEEGCALAGARGGRRRASPACP
jgi:Kef-type K+ transport system membrane component KefB